MCGHFNIDSNKITKGQKSGQLQFLQAEPIAYAPHWYRYMYMLVSVVVPNTSRLHYTKHITALYLPHYTKHITALYLPHYTKHITALYLPHYTKHITTLYLLHYTKHITALYLPHYTKHITALYLPHYTKHITALYLLHYTKHITALYLPHYTKHMTALSHMQLALLSTREQSLQGSPCSTLPRTPGWDLADSPH